ncbi:MAG: methionine adenosyltransferase [Myxococcota bacterium]|nr:methionine adenosyltransferase [Myxococcota bacterium]
MEQKLFTSESVSKGHPDKIADQISDAFLDACLSQDSNSKVACETLVTTGLVQLAGELHTEAYVHAQDIARRVLRDIGYVHEGIGFEADSCAVLSSLHRQSADSRQGVENAADDSATGAGDQGMMFGFACNETPELMPAPIRLSHRLIERHRESLESGELGYLRPDAKSQVTIEYAGDTPQRISAVVLSTQHSPDVSWDQIKKEVRDEIIRPTLPAEWVDDDTIFHVNPTGRFVVGGPMGDAGLTGRKIIVDTYGGMGRHGGGAFSGKDPSKVDRSAAYAARWVAKNVVKAGLATRCEVQLAYAIGVAEPVSIRVDSFETGSHTPEALERLVRKHFDLTPAGIIESLDLKRPIYRATSYHGHFGREDQGFPWEETGKAEALARDAAR